MDTFIPFPKIKNYRNMVRDHAGSTEKIRYVGTVKLHGTNAGIRIKENKIYPQSRKRSLTADDDNHGFAAWALADPIVNEIAMGANPDDDFIIYGEWIGKGIQRGVAIAQIDHKEFVQIVVYDVVNDEWFVPTKNMPSIHGALYPTIMIDFEHPQNALPELEQATYEVEEKCPYAFYKHGISGTGEGLVWIPVDANGNLHYERHDLMFKTKGEKHSNSKSARKPKIILDAKELGQLAKLVDELLPSWRLEQGLEHIPELTIQNIGVFLKWVNQDVLSEESNAIEGSGIDRKLVMKDINKRAKTFYMEKLRKF